MLISNQLLNACDICGCSINNGFSSILPQFQKNYLGQRTSFARYQSSELSDPNISNQESSWTSEIWGRYFINNRLQFVGSLPFQIKSQQEDRQINKISGMGDATLSFNYTLINLNNDSIKWKHLLLVGDGVKMKTAKSNAMHNGELLPMGLQAGSGSNDLITTLQHSIRHNKMGLSTDFLYKINRNNKANYKFGNKLNISSRAYYWKNLNKNCNLLPSVGVLYEVMKKDLKNDYVQLESGGYLLSTNVGCDIYFKHFMASFLYFYPLKQQLSNGYVQAKSKIQINNSYIF